MFTMPGPRVKGKRSSAVQLRAAHVRPLQSGSLLAVRLKAADVTAAVRFRGRIWNPPLQSCCRVAASPTAPQAVAR